MKQFVDPTRQLAGFEEITVRFGPDKSLRRYFFHPSSPFRAISINLLLRIPQVQGNARMPCTCLLTIVAP
jgi:hypothetical protein